MAQRKTTEFHCHRDGRCCAFVGVVYPWLTDDGIRCRHLKGVNECEIYARRPWICNYKEVAKRTKDPEAFLEVQNEVCRQLRKMKRPSLKKVRKALRRVRMEVEAQSSKDAGTHHPAG